MIDWILKRLGLVRVSRLFEKQDHYFLPDEKLGDHNVICGFHVMPKLAEELGMKGQMVSRIQFDYQMFEPVRMTVTRYTTKGDMQAALRYLRGSQARPVDRFELVPKEDAD